MATVAAFATFGVGFLARPFGGLFFGTPRRQARPQVGAGRHDPAHGRRLDRDRPPADVRGDRDLGADPARHPAPAARASAPAPSRPAPPCSMAEYSPVRRRGFFSALPFVGIQAGTLLAAVVFGLITLAARGGAARLGLARSRSSPPSCSSSSPCSSACGCARRPTFIELEKHEQIAEQPVREIFTKGLPGVIVGIGLRMAENGGSYMFQTLALAFFVATIGQQRRPQPAHLGRHDRLAHRHLLGAAHRARSPTGSVVVPVYRFGAVFMLLYAFPAWWLLSLGNYWVAIAVIAVGIGVARQLDARPAVRDAPRAVRQPPPLPRRRDGARALRGASPAAWRVCSAPT